MAKLLFVLGNAGTGKSSLAKKLIRKKVSKGESWVLLDKDTCGYTLSKALRQCLGLDPFDRDSPIYKEKFETWNIRLV